ncbi:hypothetical protein HGA91_04480 [candidate division WWE3 bacterium]|nr:hypothetical protein [candidate division WWE3 bacterium]
MDNLFSVNIFCNSFYIDAGTDNETGHLRITSTCGDILHFAQTYLNETAIDLSYRALASVAKTFAANYLKIRTPARYEQKFITKDKANILFDFSCRAYTSNFHSTRTTNNSPHKIIAKFILRKEKWLLTNKR